MAEQNTETKPTAKDAKRPVERLVKRDCSSCKHYAEPEDGYSCGQCNYPLPAWLKSGCSNGGFVATLQGDDCVTYERSA